MLFVRFVAGHAGHSSRKSSVRGPAAEVRHWANLHDLRPPRRMQSRMASHPLPACALRLAAKLVLRTLPICGVTHHRTPCMPAHAKESVGKLLAARFSLHPPSGTDGRFFCVDRLGGPALISFRGRARGWRSWPSRSRWADSDVCRAPRPPCCPAVLDPPLLPPCCCSIGHAPWPPAARLLRLTHPVH